MPPQDTARVAAIPLSPDVLAVGLPGATASFAAVGLASGAGLIGALIRRARGAVLPKRTIARFAVTALAALGIGYAGYHFRPEPLFRLLWNRHYTDRSSPWCEAREQRRRAAAVGQFVAARGLRRQAAPESETPAGHWLSSSGCWCRCCPGGGHANIRCMPCGMWAGRWRRG